ncbi:hypothetical protein KHQ82_07495 [Mycoplasmatota bacterium]|nr:hypothetical protein KHQ82_07495 [Mycoplasmatota bacterium]
MRIKVHFSTYILILLCLLSGFVVDVLIIFASISFHELAHVIASRCFKKKVNKITILPFGGIFEINDHQNVNLLEEVIILIAGPLGSLFLLQFEAIYHINMIILIFNLIPIYPLDGGKIFEVILCRFLNYKFVLKFIFIMSIIFSVIIFIYSIKHSSFNIALIGVVLLILNIKNYHGAEIKYWNFLNDKVLFSRKLPLKVHKRLNINNLYKGYNNVFIEGGNVVTEYQLIKNYNFNFEKKY